MLETYNQDILFSIIAGSILLFLLCSFIVAFSRLYVKKRKQHINERQLIARQYKDALIQSELEIKEQTMQNIGQELHDNLGQVASLIKIHLNTLNLNETSKAKEKIEESKNLVRQLINDIKQLSVNLNSGRIAQMGLVRSLEYETDRLNKIGQFEVSLKVDGKFSNLPDDLTLILYRMSQEIINNIISHSKADKIFINLSEYHSGLKLLYRDDGIGFDLEENKVNTGSGLINLEARAKLINSNFEIKSSQKNGTEIKITVPLIQNYD